MYRVSQVQSERMGAPITAYNRISSDVIRVHFQYFYDPDFVAVVDETLLHTVDAGSRIEKRCSVINTAKSKEEIMPQLNGYERSHELPLMQNHFERHLENILNSMLAAVVATTGVMQKETFYMDALC